MGGIVKHLVDAGAVIEGSHLVYTSGMHGRAYINMREVAHDVYWLTTYAAGSLADVLTPSHRAGDFDTVLGPETLGRTLATASAAKLGVPGVWCKMLEEDGKKMPYFEPEMYFERFVYGRRIAIVDDLLTSGSSISAVAELVRVAGGLPVIAAVVVRRTADVGAAQCGTDQLLVVDEVEGFEVFTPQQCAISGPCSEGAPILRRPGHGYKYEATHPGYVGGFA